MENYHVIDLVGEGSFGKVRSALRTGSLAQLEHAVVADHDTLSQGHRCFLTELIMSQFSQCPGLQPHCCLHEQVYKGRRRWTGQITAMKFIMKHGKSEKDIKNLRQEIEILRTLKHENIIQMLDSFETKDEFCVVTEFAQGAGPQNSALARLCTPAALHIQEASSGKAVRQSSECR